MPRIPMNDAYLRQPTLHGDTVVFVSDDDLWRVGSSGGVAQRLTAGLSEPATPCLSPDGPCADGEDEMEYKRGVIGSSILITFSAVICAGNG